MRCIQTDELKELQMQILDYVDAFCRSNGIRYTLSGGSLLGAIRHKGFIPWDDDIDIQMLRGDYQRFTELWMEKETNTLYELINIESDNNQGYPFGKVQNVLTTSFIGKIQRTGVFIDIFPLDKVRDESDFIKRHQKVVRLYKLRGLVFKLMRIGMGGLMMNLYRRLARRINNVAKMNESCECDWAFEMTSGLLCKKPMPMAIFNEYTNTAFENRQYMTVKDYDTYLSLTFGNYMVLPPEEKRVPHHDAIFYWK